jgi:type I restriction enzyme S subunit
VSWAVVTLGEIARSVRNGIFAKRPTDEPGGSRILRISAVRDGRVNLADAKYVTGLDPAQVNRFSVKSGDLLITRYNGSRPLVGIAGIVPPHDEPVIHPDKLIRVVIDRSRAEPRFVNYQFQSPQVRAHLEPRIRTTAGQSGIAGADVRSVPLVLPPLDDQCRIVDILEDHLSRLETGESSLTSAMRRASLLNNAVLAELHTGRPVALETLTAVAGYGTSVKCVAEGHGPPVVRIPNLVDGRIDLTDEKRAYDADVDLLKYMLSPGDVLIIRTNGSVDLIGRSAVVQSGVEAAFASYLIRYQLRADQVRAKWVHTMLGTPQVRARIESMAASSAGQHNLSLGKLNSLELPVPSFAVQDAGLERLTKIKSDLTRLSLQIARARIRAEGLRTALLDAAFSGRLTHGASDVEVVLESV